MQIKMNRRHVLRMGAGILGALALEAVMVNPARSAVKGRELRINTLSSAAAVNVPLQVALRDILPSQNKDITTRVQPTAKISQIVQEVVTGGADLGDADIATTLLAAEAGADIRIIGLSYSNTTQVVVVNTDKIKSLADFGTQQVTVAVNSIGDFTHVMILGVLKKHNIDPAKVNFIEIGSSGDRMRSLAVGRVDAVPVHIEQAEQLKKIKGRGTFDILIRPWEEFRNWYSVVLIASEKWLAVPENQTAAVEALKAVLTSFRKTDSDYAWYKEQVSKYATSAELRSADDVFLHPVWETLTSQVKAFPPDMETLTVNGLAEILPVYRDAGVLKGNVDLNKLVDLTYLKRAIAELGAS
ncbi:TPA: ABC transporter substrate-binding protein [Klebsiella michiganensis]|nr:ABC transporter substrate-binding protein [Klebsiella michiganensis]